VFFPDANFGCLPQQVCAGVIIAPCNALGAGSCFNKKEQKGVGVLFLSKTVCICCPVMKKDADPFLFCADIKEG
jgi:hypothetical protein